MSLAIYKHGGSCLRGFRGGSNLQSAALSVSKEMGKNSGRFRTLVRRSLDSSCLELRLKASLIHAP